MAHPAKSDEQEKTPAIRAEKAETVALPGAKGLLCEKVGNLKGGVEVIGGDVGVETCDPDKPPKRRTLPSGSKTISVAVKFNRKPQFETIGLQIANNAGEVNFSDGNAITSEDARTGAYAVEFFRKVKEGLADGPYQAKIKVDGQIVVLINWSIGEPRN